jgi:hypothetical protein
MQPLPIYAGSHKTKAPQYAGQSLINWYVMKTQGAALSDAIIYGVEGIINIATAGNYKFIGRGAWVKNDIPYFVQGGSLVRLNSDGTLIVLGGIAGTKRCSMASNETQLMIVNELGNGYIWDDATLQPIVDVDFTANGTPISVCTIDGYFACPTDEKKFILSAIEDGMSWNALDFARADGDPDAIQALIPFKGVLYPVGVNTIEGFNNVGGADFPFSKINGLIVNKGLSFRHAYVVASDAFYFVGGGYGESPAIWMSNGQAAQKISTDAEDYAIRLELSKEGIEDSFAFQYSIDGAYFVGFSFPEKTLVYELTGQTWHERKSFIDGELVRWRPNAMVQAYGALYVSDSQDGRIGKLDVNTYKEYGNLIYRELTTQPFSNNGDRILCAALELTMESGAGDAETPNPQIRMATSKDGKTFADERTRSTGSIGEYRKRAVWRRNGRYDRLMVLRFTMTDPVNPTIIKLEGLLA